MFRQRSNNGASDILALGFLSSAKSEFLIVCLLPSAISFLPLRNEP